MSTNPERSRLARVSALLRQAQQAEAAGRAAEAASALLEVVRLDPHDRRSLHRLGDIHRHRLSRYREAASFYAREARAQEREGFHGRAIAVWRLVLRCDPGRLEAHERIGALYVEAGHLADARLHYERSALELKEAGLAREAAILRAHLAALEAAEETAGSAPPPAGPIPAAARPVGPGPEPSPGSEPVADATALDLAADRLQTGRLFHHYGLHEQARRQLEELLASLPEHLEARQLLVEVCRALGDAAGAAQHLLVTTRLLRRQGRAGRGGGFPGEPPAAEEWGLPEEPANPLAELMDEIRDDVVRLVVRLEERKEDR